jgi:PAS domain S-box-containing protein
MVANFICFITFEKTKFKEEYFRNFFPDVVFFYYESLIKTDFLTCKNPFLIINYSDLSSKQLLTELAIFESDYHKILLREAHIKTSMLNGELLDFFDEIAVISENEDRNASVLSRIKGYADIEIRYNESERKYKTLVETLPGIIYRCKNDSDWTMIFLSPKIARLCGYPPRDLINNNKLSYSDIILPQYREYVWLTIQKAIKANHSFNMEYQIRTSAGRTKWVWEQGKAISDAAGNLFIEGVIIDITDRKLLNEKVEIMRELTIAFSFARDLPQMVQIIKKTLEKIIPSAHLSLALFDKEKKEFLIPYMEHDRECFSIENGSQSLRGMVMRRKKSILLVQREIDKLIRQGKIEMTGDLPAVWLGVPLFIHGIPAGIVSICHPDNEFAIDKTDKDLIEFVSTQVSVAILKKQAEEESNKMAQAFEQIPAAVFIMELDFKIVYANKNTLTVTGFDSDEMIGKIPKLFQPEYHSPDAVEAIKQQLLQAGLWSGEFENKRKDGAQYYENVIVSCIRNHHNKVTHYVMLKNDISEQKRLQKQLIETTRRAEESDNLKSSFMANISHEIRTPMNAIIGFVEMLKNDDFSQEEKTQFVDLVLENARNLMGKLNNIIDITKIESGKLKLTNSLCSANKILYDHYYMLLKNMEKLEKTGIEIIPKQHIENENFLFTSDAYRISQVLQKLIENALKYTFSGSIQIGYTIQEDEQDSWIDFYVKDSGVGVSRELEDVIFDKFKTSGNDPYKASAATGFGLYIAKNIARLLGGDLLLETASKKDATFHLKIPFRQATFEKSETPANAKTEKKHLHFPDKIILIAEDEEPNFKLLEVMLRKTGAKIVRAHNGKQAVDYLQEGNHADLILMDVRMPVMNGFEATGQIKNINPTIPVVIQTAFAFVNDREKGFGSGCDEYLSKPIKASDLYLLLQKYLDP